MYYDVNISLNGRHFFATADRSITDREKLRQVLPVLVRSFPRTSGYEISVTQRIETGHFINFDKATGVPAFED